VNERHLLRPSNSSMQGQHLQTGYLKSEPFFIWVLAPHLETDDPSLQHFYDFEANMAEFTKAFAELDLPWKWQVVTLDDYKKVIDHISESANGHIPLVFNLCDGDEVNNTPGISVLRYLEEKQLIYTGAREAYYHLTTSKITMKQAFDNAGIATPPWLAITSPEQDLRGFCNKIGLPVIVKPAVSGGSMGLGLKNVVNNDDELKKIVIELYQGYHGWDFTFGGLIAEKFIAGPEFTSFLVGSYDQPGSGIVFQPVERVFSDRLPENEKFLSFERLWETYEEEKPCENAAGEYEDFYNYFLPAKELEKEICQLSWDAFCAVQGTGYSRVDLRMDKDTGKFYVLEVNAQCGLSEDENYTSIGGMVRLGKHGFSDMLKAILENALATKMKDKAVATRKAFTK